MVLCVAANKGQEEERTTPRRPAGHGSDTTLLFLVLLPSSGRCVKNLPLQWNICVLYVHSRSRLSSSLVLAGKQVWS